MTTPIAEPRTAFTEFRQLRIKQSRGLALHFIGRLLAEVDDDPRHEKEEWHRHRLYETPAGNWVAVRDAMKGDIAAYRDAVVIPPMDDALARAEAVMDALHWYTLAFNLAKAMGWVLVREVA